MMESVAESSSPRVRPRRRVGQWLSLCVAGVVVLVVVAEVALRLVFGLGSPLLYQLDPACGYLPKPDQHIHRFFSDNIINHEGMRSPEFQATRAAGTQRVLLIGDSVTYATTFVDQRLIWTSLLGGTLPVLKGRPVEILNASAGGWAPANELGYLRSRGTFDASIVLIVANTGDLGEEMAKISEEGELFPTRNPWSAIGETWSRYLKPRLFHRVLADPGTSLPESEILAERTEENLQLYSEAKGFCDAHHTPFGIVYIPFVGWPRDTIVASEHAFADWTAKNHVPFIDLTARLTRENPSKITKDGMHPNPYGDQVIADEIAQQWDVIDAATGFSTTQPATQK